MELEDLEKIIKQKSDHKCVICHKEAEQIYALKETNEIIEDNMILLCHFCAHKYLGNKDTLKQIKQIRDYWYDQVERAIKEIGTTDILITKEDISTDRLNVNTVAIYHVVYENEGLEESAKTIYELLYSAQEKQPNDNRILYLDIDGHTDEYGRFDREMLELQQNFIIEIILPYFYEIHTPMLDIRNTEQQRNDIPKEMNFISNEQELIKFLTKEMQSGGYLIEKLKKEYYVEKKKVIYIKKKEV